jgi:hypothetical protein
MMHETCADKRLLEVSETCLAWRRPQQLHQPNDSRSYLSAFFSYPLSVRPFAVRNCSERKAKAD